MSDRAGQQWDGIEPNPEFRVLFVRHAESEINIIPELEIPRHALPPDSGVTYPLSKRGMQQASAIGDALAGERVVAIYSSTRMRCAATGVATLAGNDLDTWVGSLQSTITRGGATACGQITGCPANCQIIVQWDDQRAGGSATRQLVTRTSI